jgi:hypothetical protein
VLSQAPSNSPRVEIDLEALFCALVLAPTTYSRNRFFGVFETVSGRRVRRRAARVRGVVRQLLGQGRPRAEVVGERVLEDGRVFLRYRIEQLAFERTVALSPLEAATLRYAMHQAGAGELMDEDRDRVLETLQRLGRDLPV